MAEETNVLVNSDNDNGTQSATWTTVEQVDPNQKVLVGRMDPLSGNMVASWDNIPVTPPANKNRNDVNIYDYDGTLIESYTASEFAELSEYPPQPAHELLTGRGYNWSLTDAKTYVTTYGRLEIGAQYEVTDGKTRLFIHLEEGRFKPTLTIQVDGTAMVDWGDGSEMSTLTGIDYDEDSCEHEYAAAGDYVISITVTGSFAFAGDRTKRSEILSNGGTYGVRSGTQAYLSSLRSVLIGNNITSLDNYVFENCHNLESVMIPSNILYTGLCTFDNCYNLNAIIIPNGMGSIGDMCRMCYSLSALSIPLSVTGIADGGSFTSCYSLTRVTLPPSLTNIENAFAGCVKLESITVPSTVTGTLRGIVNNCYCLTSFTFPSEITSIGDQCLYACSSLAGVDIPANVASIGELAFSDCNSLGYIKFTSAIPPTVEDRYAFGDLPTDCIIYVPTGSLSAYTSATNYPDSNTYTYVEY